eukprot:768447-Hanusia_phi.AAC.5
MRHQHDVCSPCDEVASDQWADRFAANVHFHDGVAEQLRIYPSTRFLQKIKRRAGEQRTAEGSGDQTAR